MFFLIKFLKSCKVLYKYINESDIEILYVMDIGSRGDIYK